LFKIFCLFLVIYVVNQHMNSPNNNNKKLYNKDYVKGVTLCPLTLRLPKTIS